MFPRLVPAALIAVAVSFSGPSAFAQSREQRPGDQPAQGDKNTQKTDELAEAAAALNGPAGNAECVWTGRQVVKQLWNNDLDLAFRHLDLYDRFGCPPAHFQAAFRCLIKQGPLDGNKAEDTLNARVQACWINPGPLASPQAPAPTTANPARR